MRTPLRPNIAFHLVHEAQPTRSMLAVDVMCGCGTIGEVASREFGVFCISGDICREAVAKAAHNAALSGEMVDVVQWDASRLPLRPAVVDRVICDLPFGKRCGSKVDNRTLYPTMLGECHRVVTYDGLAVFVSADRSAAKQLLNTAEFHASWVKQGSYALSIGGLEAVVFRLSKTKKSHGEHGRLRLSKTKRSGRAGCDGVAGERSSYEGDRKRGSEIRESNQDRSRQLFDHRKPSAVRTATIDEERAAAPVAAAKKIKNAMKELDDVLERIDDEDGRALLRILDVELQNFSERLRLKKVEIDAVNTVETDIEGEAGLTGT